MTAAVQSGRAACFKVVGSLLYNEPGEQILNTLKKERIFAEIPFKHENKTLENGRRILENWLDSADTNELADKAKDDYMRLFVGMGKVLAPPWGSVYQDKDRLLFTENTLKVRRYYESRGVKLKMKHKEPDDHIGLELEFAAVMLERERPGDAAEFALLHMRPWAAKWTQDVLQHSNTGYYKGLAQIASGCIDIICG